MAQTKLRGTQITFDTSASSLKTSGSASVGVLDFLPRIDHVHPGREVLTANRTYYVRTDGNDSNTGLVDSAAGAFLTIQKAVDIVLELDLSGYSVLIQISDGTYTSGINVLRPFIGGHVTVQGNMTTPSSVSLALPGSGNVVVVTNGGHLTVQGLKVSNSGAGAGLYASAGGFINANTMDFGAVMGDHIEAADQGKISIFNTTYTISGSGSSHWHAHCGNITDAYNTITITNTPAFVNYFAGIAYGSIQCQNNTFTGLATGKRFLIHYLGFILTATNDLTYLPGNASGALESGGQYDEITGLGADSEWIYISNACSYNSPFSITVSTGAALIYSVGDKLRIRQGESWKYFYITIVADTLLTVCAGKDYSVADATITDVYYSKVETPIGFPQWFALSDPIWTASGTSFGEYPPTTADDSFIMVGKTVILSIQNLTHASSPGTGVFFAIYTDGELPPVKTHSVGLAQNKSTAVFGNSYAQAASNPTIGICKPDATAIATTAQYFCAQLQYKVG
jgi:hypothetical protein